MMAACTSEEQRPASGERAMYWWRATYDPDSAEQAFMGEHHIGRLYVRYFDVALNDKQQPMPVGTCQLRGSRPEGVDIVPTVFIMDNCLWADTTLLAQHIVERVRQMTATHDMGPIGEIQVDCDYTKRSQQRYYDLLQRMHTLLYNEGIRLSATIRLHQLSMAPPPVDEGVLMVYNTGDVKQLNGRNPILDIRDVKPYLRYLKGYRLPLTAAYPLFEWRVLFHNNEFRHIAYNETDAQCRLQGDTLLRWQCTTDDILSVKGAVGRARHDIHKQVTLYHLDRELIKKHTKEDYEKIFSF